ncbi:hypothetical protein GOB86_14665 [Acetobacter lambici]|uniref:Uncharacterized protein n=1 Tax=Acetobacter lambici TaxID=1332824 RepID=A0ABT1F4X6_9PROT|nr:hypothetical protein [Acetobacter lambici]MCP1244256.1 hypothetical protein [Acetobacter lambici]MCP1260208.1 hypothetical protein [Acetobacter lambici]NHO58255.1 hypothetical protein [Acetobacter lambici]
MPQHPHPLLRVILPPQQTRKHKEDRLKAVASLTQSVALAIIGVGLVTPLFSNFGALNLQTALAALCAALLFEFISLVLLALIPYDADKED